MLINVPRIDDFIRHQGQGGFMVHQIFCLYPYILYFVESMYPELMTIYSTKGQGGFMVHQIFDSTPGV